MDKNHRPQDCALAVCIPTTWNQFKADVAGGNRWDFARSIMRPYQGHRPQEVWETIVEPAIDLVKIAVETVARLGVYVQLRSPLSELPGLCRAFRVVTVLTHWRSGELFADQIQDADGLLRRLQAANGRAAQAVRASWEERQGMIPMHANLETFADSFCSAGNAILATADLSPSAYPTLWHRSSLEAYRVHANRSVMDWEFADDLVPGTRAEFADGMHAVPAFAEAIPQDFEGVLDLTMCNSLMACEEIKLYRTLTCIGNERRTPLRLRAEIYSETIRVLGETETSYVDASRDLRIAINEELARRGI